MPTLEPCVLSLCDKNLQHLRNFSKLEGKYLENSATAFGRGPAGTPLYSVIVCGPRLICRYAVTRMDFYHDKSPSPSSPPWLSQKCFILQPFYSYLASPECEGSPRGHFLSEKTVSSRSSFRRQICDRHDLGAFFVRRSN